MLDKQLKKTLQPHAAPPTTRNAPHQDTAPQTWQKVILHVDMDAFFAAVEQRDFPEFRGRPVAVTNGTVGSCIITRSYEARQYGVKTGMRFRDAVKLCPDLVRRPARPYVYADASAIIMSLLEAITPDIEIFSVDEAFLELTHCRTLYPNLQAIGQLIKEQILSATQLTCSVGISCNKTMAKFASKQNKPNGLLIIPPWETKQTLAPIPVTTLCGIAKGVERFLAQYGVYRCGDIEKIPMNVLSKRFGNLGKRIWLMCQGEDPDPLQKNIADPKSMGHGKVLPPNTTDKTSILAYLNHMSEKLGRRLRKHNMQAQTFFIGLKTADGWLASKYKTSSATHDGKLIYQMAKQLVEIKWASEGAYQCQITALDPQPTAMQGDLFDSEPVEANRIQQVVDAVNERFGNSTLINGIRLTRLQTPDVISPAWRPTGHRSL